MPKTMPEPVPEFRWTYGGLPDDQAIADIRRGSIMLAERIWAVLHGQQALAQPIKPAPRQPSLAELAGRKIAPSAIIIAAASACGLTSEDVTGHGITRQQIWARFIALLIMRATDPEMPTKKMGALIGRSYSTVLKAMQRAQYLHKTDPRFTAAVDKALALLAT